MPLPPLPPLPPPISWAVPNSDDEEEEQMVPHHHASPSTKPASRDATTGLILLHRTILSAGALLCVLALAGFVGRITTTKTTSTSVAPAAAPQYALYNDPSTDPRVYHCGHNLTTALAANCIFDPITFAWVPPQCADPQLAAEFRALYAHRTIWHGDVDQHTAVGEHAFATGAATAYLTDENHVLHCVFAWRRLHRAVLAGQSYHSGLSLTHTEHCGMVVRETAEKGEAEGPRRISTRALVIYPRC